MGIAQQPDGGQPALWNGPAGHAWAAMQQTLDRMFEPFEETLAEAATHATQVLDVGCGAGSTTLALAGRLGTRGSCHGIDVSGPLVALARTRAREAGAQVRFTCADAQTHVFAPDSFDLIVSRFGVMFFDDPVRAFANLRRAAREHATLRFVAWRNAAENPFMTAAGEGARRLLPQLAERQLDGPGQFAFADARRVRHILEQSGWSAIEIRRLDREATFAEQDLIPYLTQMGPLGRALPGLDEATRALAVEAARSAFEPYVHGPEVRFTAACWQVDARADGGDRGERMLI